MIEDSVVRLIIVDRSSNEAEHVLNVLRKAGYGVRPKHVADAETFAESVEEQGWDLVLAVPEIDDFTLGDVLQILARTEHDIPVIGVTERHDEQNLVDGLRAGAKDMVPRSEPERLLLVVGRELANLSERRARRRSELRRWESERRCMALLDTSQDAIAYVHQGMHIHANAAYLRLFGYKDIYELEGFSLLDLVAQEDSARFKEFLRGLAATEDDQEIEVKSTLPDGELLTVCYIFSHATFDGEDCLQVLARDISKHKEYEKKLNQLTRRDHLTGLYNQRHFMRLLEKAVAGGVKKGRRSVLVFIELENFAAIKQTVGIAESDTVIQEVAGVVGQQLAEEDVLARLGDQTFAAILARQDLKSAQAVAERIREAVKAHVCEVGGRSVASICSLGVVQINELSANPQEVLAQAEAACRGAIRQGGDRVQVHEVTREPPVALELSSDASGEIEAAMRDGRLTLVFQPVVSLHGETEEIYEALVRMYDRDGEPIASQTLFNVAEKANLIKKLDQWVVDNAIRILEQQVGTGRRLRFFMKLSDDAIKDESTLLHLSKRLRGIPPAERRLTFEISETTAVSQVRLARSFINALKQLHCSTALEHFGVGLNSFTALNHLDVEYLKIDSSLIQNLSQDEESQGRVRSIQDTAAAMQKATVATHVQDAGSLAVLWQCGVSYAQGNYIQEPSAELSYDFSASAEI